MSTFASCNTVESPREPRETESYQAERMGPERFFAPPHGPTLLRQRFWFPRSAWEPAFADAPRVQGRLLHTFPPCLRGVLQFGVVVSDFVHWASSISPVLSRHCQSWPIFLHPGPTPGRLPAAEIVANLHQAVAAGRHPEPSRRVVLTAGGDAVSALGPQVVEGRLMPTRGMAGKTRITPPQLCSNISCTAWEARKLPSSVKGR